MVQTDLSNGALADLHGHRLKLWVRGQIKFVVPQKLVETRGKMLHSYRCIR